MKRLIALFICFFILIIPFCNIPTSADFEPVYGIDVSRWQGDSIDWIKVKNDGINFAIIRAYSYGEDLYFQRNYSGAIAAGLDVGAYSYTYAETIEEAITEANDLVRVLGKRKFQYPVFIDIEDPFYQSINKNLTTQIVLTELEILKKAGYYAAIYSGKYFAETYLNLSALSDYDIWIAQYNSTCTFKGEYTMWQYSDSGSVDGIYGSVDTNYCYVDYPHIISQSGLNFIFENNQFPMGGKVTADILNIREGPSTSYAAITQIPYGTAVSVNGIEGNSNWYVVSFHDSNNKYRTGYCSSDYIKLQKIYDVLGDIDTSGTVDATDALFVLHHTVGKIVLPEEALECADVNWDKEITPNDALIILHFSVGKITSFN